MKKGALVTSIAMVLVTVMALTVVSFAWFSASLNPTVGAWDVQVTTSDALLISAKKDAGFKTTLPYTDLTAADLGNLFPAGNAADGFTQVLNTATPKFAAKPSGAFDVNVFDKASGIMPFMVAKSSAVDAGFTGNWGTGSDAYDYVDVATNVNQTVEDAAATADPKDIRFVKFDLYFKSTIVSYDSVKVNLDLTSVGTAKDISTYAGTKFEYTGRKTGVTGWTSEIAKIVRVAFASAPITDVAAGTVDTTKYSVKFYEADGDHVAGVANDIAAYDSTALYTSSGQNSVYTKIYNAVLTKVVSATAVADTASSTITGTAAMTRADLWEAMVTNPDQQVNLTIGGTAADVSFNSMMTAENANWDALTAGVADLELFTIGSGEVWKTTVYMWLEGNDQESNNFVSGGLFKSAFNFKGEGVTTP